MSSLLYTLYIDKYQYCRFEFELNPFNGQENVKLFGIFEYLVKHSHFHVNISLLSC